MERVTGNTALSLSARRAWIEISVFIERESGLRVVALRKESVDRNLGYGTVHQVNQQVALRKESVDRNISREISLIRPYVALRKESVDRNMGVGTTRDSLGGRSPQGERG